MKRKFTRMVAMLLTVLIFGSTFPTTSLAAIDSGSMPTITDSMPQEPAADPPQSISQPDTGDTSASSNVASEPAQSESSPPASESVPPTSSSSESLPPVSDSSESDINSGSTSSSASESSNTSSSDLESDSSDSNSSNEPLEPNDTAPFIPLEITEMSTTFSGKPGDVVDFFVKLNREDVAVTYQWQRLYTGKSYDGEGEAIHDYSEGESTRYIFTLDGMSEEEILKINPDATWPGIEMYYDQLEKANGNAAEIDIAPNTPNYILDSEAAAAMNAGKPDTVCGVLVE